MHHDKVTPQGRKQAMTVAMAMSSSRRSGAQAILAWLGSENKDPTGVETSVVAAWINFKKKKDEFLKKMQPVATAAKNSLSAESDAAEKEVNKPFLLHVAYWQDTLRVALAVEEGLRRCFVSRLIKYVDIPKDKLQQLFAPNWREQFNPSLDMQTRKTNVLAVVMENRVNHIKIDPHIREPRKVIDEVQTRCVHFECVNVLSEATSLETEARSFLISASIVACTVVFPQLHGLHHRRLQQTAPQ